MLILKNDRPNFKEIFSSYLKEYEEEMKKSYSSRRYSRYDDYEDFYDAYDDYGGYSGYYDGVGIDDYDDFNYSRSMELLDSYQRKYSVTSPNYYDNDMNGRKGKRKRLRGKNKRKNLELFPRHMDGIGKKRYSDNKANMFSSHDDTMIFWYDDVDNPDNNLTFYSIFDFDKFLEENGINVSSEEINNLMSRGLSHCCLNPSKCRDGILEIMSDSSYGGLRWACAESDDELLENDKNAYSP